MPMEILKWTCTAIVEAYQTYAFKPRSHRFCGLVTGQQTFSRGCNGLRCGFELRLKWLQRHLHRLIPRAIHEGWGCFDKKHKCDGSESFHVFAYVSYLFFAYVRLLLVKNLSSRKFWLHPLVLSCASVSRRATQKKKIPRGRPRKPPIPPSPDISTLPIYLRFNFLVKVCIKLIMLVLFFLRTTTTRRRYKERKKP